MHRSSSSPLPPQGMPRSSSAAAITTTNNNNPKVRAQPSSRIVRGQISSPIPMQDPLDKELYIRPHDTGASGYAQPPHVNLSKPSMETSRPSAEFARRRISSTPERSRSVLRTALSKIFGRKKAIRPITPLASADSEDERQDSHFSDDKRDSIPAQRIPPKKIETFPISEYDRALRSHSVGPEDVMAIRSARSPVNPEYSGHARKRNGTGSDAHPASARWVKPTGLTPRPASTTDWGSRLVDASHDPEEIGRAVTTGLKRRSRSLSFIPLIETAEAPNITRRRSDEFPRGWRESYDQEPASPISSTAPDGGDRRTFVSQKSNDEAELVDEIDSPVKPFTFSNMPYMAEFAGTASMKITDAVGLETRIGQVENRLSLVEGLLTHARQASPGDGLADDSSERLAPPMPAWSSTFSTAVRPSSHSSAQVSGTSRLSFGEIPTYTRSASQQTSKQPMFAASTLSKSVPTGSFIMDHETYNALVSTMENDRAARLALEAQVKELSRQISRLSKNIPATRTAQVNDEVASPSFGKPPVLDFGEDEEEEDDDLRTKKSRRSFRKAQNEDSGIGTESGDRDYPESFATLNDEHHNSKADLPFSSPDAILSLSKLTTLHSMAHPASQQTVSQPF
ncbi:uncharacterized protein TrAtP1_004183 [Trichoderma atroviride]|uniref:Uncharacterized protein n=1 Tax=Hypocrea atroviridis (strain ATCC 20476 / IMI 206040) TaxID=452589 RepID=G9P7S1_HYPAI|nr:uncharacterized protein TRIATDRAFT_30317 [Trichoderma atroviride IMI 206040]EHK40824.1 hypothetical protein TRIATDRAFT_30317 [Trichoderma atroviride IMI 206040]UKZ62953.1 hypothetical protein TrAtP1_004183 [Trichoderma atroviride]